jgi:hypothetical protein
MCNHDCARTDAEILLQSVSQAATKADLHRQEKIELLNWVIKLCGTGMTIGMVRGLVANKILEIERQEKNA